MLKLLFQELKSHSPGTLRHFEETPAGWLIDLTLNVGLTMIPTASCTVESGRFLEV